ncbi:AfsR/SARP family transcriptional regulator [Candidatus Magnetominusculus dajiuhuensis]|uniref:AfsR/SARP family transcriptional regulator n=1 Tax=Candidatus Magnetominusculus dajiuhuensis TaxID=3137712 RepID=UPI003B42A193
MNHNFPESEAYPVQICTLGRFKIAIDNNFVNIIGNSQDKPIAMLKAIIALGVKDVAISKVSDALWPDIDGDKATSVFRVTVHRLRKLFGRRRGVIVTHNSHACLNSDDCWTDVLALQDVANEFDRMIALPDVEQKIDVLCNKAFSLYNGDFLPGDQDHVWIAYQREHLKDMFVNLCCNAGTYYRGINKWDKAIDVYKKAIETDNLRETCYRGMIDCCLKANLNGEALCAYNKCKHVFNTMFDIDPSEETRSLIRTIKKNHKP